jgi:hypothetical protein
MKDKRMMITSEKKARGTVLMMIARKTKEENDA